MAAWTYTAGHYVAADGTPLTPAALRTVVTHLVDATTTRLQGLAAQRASGTLDTLGWRTAAQTVLKDATLAATALAHGGFAQLDRADYGRVGARLRTQYDYLSGFALDAAGGQVDVQSDAFLARAGLYGGSVHSTFEAERQREAADQGQDYERNLLEDGAAHCDECPSLTDQGWVPVGTFPEPGDRECLANCRCSLDYATAAEVEQDQEAA